MNLGYDNTMNKANSGSKSPLKACWPEYSAKGTKNSPSGKKNSDGTPKRVPDCKPD